MRSKGRYTTPSEVDDYVEAYCDGDSILMIAERFNREQSTVRAHLHKRGVPMRPQRNVPWKVTPELVARWRVQAAAGWSQARIARKSLVAKSTVWRALHADPSHLMPNP